MQGVSAIENQGRFIMFKIAKANLLPTNPTFKKLPDVPLLSLAAQWKIQLIISFLEPQKT